MGYYFVTDTLLVPCCSSKSTVPFVKLPINMYQEILEGHYTNATSIAVKMLGIYSSKWLLLCLQIYYVLIEVINGKKFKSRADTDNQGEVKG